MRRSLAFKLTLAFLLVSLIGVVLVAVLSRFITVREFDRFTLARARSNFVDNVSAYYQLYNSWQGIHEALRQPPPQPNQPPPLAFRPWPVAPPPPNFGLADVNGRIVLPAGSYQIGDRAPPQVLAQGTPLTVNGQVVGTILAVGNRPPRNPLETQYLNRINGALLIAALAATGAALALGFFLARTLTRPLREITAATEAVASGNLNQAVPVRSQDELGQLAVAFNRMSRDLARANQLRRQMTADIAHDLRTPLTVITGYLEALREGDLPPTPARFEAMYSEAQHLQRLVEDLRTLSLADAGELPLQRQAVSISELLQRVATAHQPQARQQSVSLHTQTPPTLPPIQADPERLVQVLGNLVSNALRYTPAGGTITLSAQAHADTLHIQVADTGSGIAPEDLPYIFNRFYRTEQARQQTNGESGLGLAIARAIVLAHGGRIWASSQPGQGTTFTVELPS